MSQPVHEMSREAMNMLSRAGDMGEPVTLAEFREELGLGHGDVMAILEQLRERGMAVEDAPGEWTAAPAEGEREPVSVSVPGEEEPAAVWMERDDTAGARAMATLMPDATVRLTRSIAEQLEAPALGQLVKAGLTDHPAERPFLLEIVP